MTTHDQKREWAARVCGLEIHGTALVRNELDLDGWGERKHFCWFDEWYTGPQAAVHMMMLIEAMINKHGHHGHNGFLLCKDDSNSANDKFYCEFSQPSWEYATANTAPDAVLEAAYATMNGNRLPEGE